MNDKDFFDRPYPKLTQSWRPRWHRWFGHGRQHRYIFSLRQLRHGLLPPMYSSVGYEVWCSLCDVLVESVKWTPGFHDFVIPRRVRKDV